MDGQFEPLCGDLAEMAIQLDTVSNNEHIPEIERQIRTLKEQTRAIYCTLPFQKIPHHLIIEMLCAANYWRTYVSMQGRDLTDNESMHTAYGPDHELPQALLP